MARIERIVFDVANRLNSRWLDAKILPSFRILDRRHTNQIEPAKSGRDEKSEATKSSFRARSLACVRQHHGNFPFPRLRYQIWPHFRFDQDDLLWRSDPKRPAHDRPKIKRRVENLHPFRRSFFCERMSGCRGGSEDAIQIRLERAQLISKFQCNYNFTDADRMNPGWGFPVQALSAFA